MNQVYAKVLNQIKIFFYHVYNNNNVITITLNKKLFNSKKIKKSPKVGILLYDLLSTGFNIFKIYIFNLFKKLLTVFLYLLKVAKIFFFNQLFQNLLLKTIIKQY